MSMLMVFRVALKALARNKMRTALTMLGMIIGVAAVITMVALGTGAQSSIETQIQAAGTNMIMVSAGNFMSGGVRTGQGNASTLTPEDAMAIQDVARRAVPRPGRQHARTGGRRQHELGHADPGHRRRPAVDSLVAGRQGRRSSARVDVATAAKVAVLGSVVHDQLFGADVDPVGQIIRINNQPFTVVGRDGEQGPVRRWARTRTMSSTCRTRR